jgi:MFS family permease
MTIVMACSFAPVPFTLILYNKLIKKKGFRFAFQYVLLVFSLGMCMLYGFSYLPAGTLRTLLGVLSGIVCSFAVGALFSVAYSIPSQLASEDEKRTGISHSAMYFAVQGLFAGVASGLGTYVVLTILKTNNVVELLTLISAIGCLVAFALTYILPKSIVELGKEPTSDHMKKGKKHDNGN